MDIDTAMAARFLTALTGDSVHTFQTFAETGGAGRSLNRIMHGTFAQRADALASLNDRGAGVFVMVNRGDGYGRKSANVTDARALFVDLDGAPVEPVLDCQLPPRIVVESSPGRWHCYWPIVDLPLERFTDAQKALAARFNADPKVNDRARVMRLPGFLHRKGEAFASRLVTAEAAPLTWHEMVQAFDLRHRFTLPDTIPEGERNAHLYKLAVSAARKGVPEAEQLKKAHSVNVTKCDPPLPAAEVAQIVASAYSSPAQGVAGLPLAIMDGDAYRSLPGGAQTLLLLAYRKRDAFNELFTLTHSECEPWVPDKKTFTRYRKKLVETCLLQLVIPPKRKQPRNGKDAKSGFYRVGNGGQIATHDSSQIGVKNHPPEALQALGSGSSKAPDSENGHFSAANDAEAAA